MNYRCHNVAPELSPIHLKWNPMCWLLGDKALPFSWEWAGLSRIPLLHNSGSRQLALCTAALGSTERRPTQWPRGYRAMFPPWIQIGLAAGEASVADNGLTTSSTNRYDLKVLTGMWNALPSACVPLRELEATWKINPFRIIGVRPNCRCRGAPEILWSIITDSPPPPPPKKHVYRILKIKVKSASQIGDGLRQQNSFEWSPTIPLMQRWTSQGLSGLCQWWSLPPALWRPVHAGDISSHVVFYGFSVPKVRWLHIHYSTY